MYVLCLSALVWQLFLIFFFFFFNATATTEIYTLSLHDALPILHHVGDSAAGRGRERARRPRHGRGDPRPRAGRDGKDRKSTRLNSSHQIISYAVFCLKKKKKTRTVTIGFHSSTYM